VLLVGVVGDELVPVPGVPRGRRWRLTGVRRVGETGVGAVARCSVGRHEVGDGEGMEESGGGGLEAIVTRDGSSGGSGSGDGGGVQMMATRLLVVEWDRRRRRTVVVQL